MQRQRKNNIVNGFSNLATLWEGRVGERMGFMGDWAPSLFHSRFCVRQERKGWSGEVSDFIS